MTGLAPLLRPLGAAARRQVHRAITLWARHLRPCAPADLVVPLAIAMAKTRPRLPHEIEYLEENHSLDVQSRACAAGVLLLLAILGGAIALLVHYLKGSQ